MPLVLASPRPAGSRPSGGRGRPPRHLADLPLAERRAVVAGLGEPPFRATQLSRHFFGRYTDRPEEMSDLPLAAREPLTQALLPRLLTPERELACDGGTTRKTLWRTFDGALVESVLMRYPDRVTMCVSSQAGCGMACPFCATGQAGLTRNLSTAEIVAQVVAGARLLAGGQVPGGTGRVSNVVFMGMGEPLANYASVLAAVRRLTDPVPEGMGISQRSVTVSTVGLVPAIARLAAERLSVTLAVSLHAPDDELRDTLVPVNRRWKVAEVLDAAWGYAAATGRRVSIEYALIKDINDHAWRADLLGSLLAGRLAHVNLIPLNPTPGSKWTASRPAAQREFVRRLEAHGVPVTVRDTRGREIDGACGQLAASASAEHALLGPYLRPLIGHQMSGGSLLRELRWRAVHWAFQTAQRDGVVTADTPAGRKFAAFGRGSMAAFPPGSIFGERWITIGEGTLIGAQVSLSAGMVPGQDLGPVPVLRIGDRCVIGRGSHIVAHHSLVIEDDVFTGPYVYITDQNHGYADPDVPIGRQMPLNAAVRIGSGSWLGAGAVVLPGACIGRNVVIAAGSVVRGTVPDRCVVAGVPARVVRSYVPGDGWSPSSGTGAIRGAIRDSAAPAGRAGLSLDRAWRGRRSAVSGGAEPPRRRARRGRRAAGRPARLAARPPA